MGGEDDQQAMRDRRMGMGDAGQWQEQRALTGQDFAGQPAPPPGSVPNPGGDTSTPGDGKVRAEEANAGPEDGARVEGRPVWDPEGRTTA
ncbi:MAG: hypothetical protein U0531_17145 [Dehalococcoidia bacterium]